MDKYFQINTNADFRQMKLSLNTKHKKLEKFQLIPKFFS